MEWGKLLFIVIGFALIVLYVQAKKFRVRIRRRWLGVRAPTVTKEEALSSVRNACILQGIPLKDEIRVDEEVAYYIVHIYKNGTRLPHEVFRVDIHTGEPLRIVPEIDPHTGRMPHF